MAIKDNIVGYWKLDESSGDASDESGNGYDLTGSGSVTQGATGKIGNAYDFAGGYYSDTLSGLSGSDISISFWAKADDTSTDYGLIRLGSQNSTGNRIILQYLSTGAFRFGQYGNALDTDTSVTSTDWQMWTITFNYDTKMRRIFLNGEEIARDLSNQVYSGNEIFYIGKDDVQTNFAGKLDEVAIWNRELGYDEILSLYNEGEGKTWENIDKTPQPASAGKLNLGSFKGVPSLFSRTRTTGEGESKVKKGFDKSEINFVPVENQAVQKEDTERQLLTGNPVKLSNMSINVEPDTTTTYLVIFTCELSYDSETEMKDHSVIRIRKDTGASETTIDKKRICWEIRDGNANLCGTSDLTEELTQSLSLFAITSVRPGEVEFYADAFNEGLNSGAIKSKKLIVIRLS
jgi:hypothetical protein